MKRHYNCRFTIEIEKQIVSRYQKGNSPLALSIEYWCDKRTIHNILDKYGVVKDFRKRYPSYMMRENARTPREARVAKLSELAYRNTDYVSNLKTGFSKEELKALIVALLITDGCVAFDKREKRKNFRLQFANKAHVLHHVLFDLLYSVYGIVPTSFMGLIKGGGNREPLFYSEYADSEEHQLAIIDLLKLSPSYKTKQTPWFSNDRFNPDDASITYILKQDLRVQKEAIRLAMCCEGSTTVNVFFWRQRKRYQLDRTFIFACTHPVLVWQWQTCFSNAGIQLNFVQDKRISTGINGLRSKRASSFLNFREFSGFLPGVPISKGHFKNFDKQLLLETIVDHFSVGRSYDSRDDFLFEMYNLLKKREEHANGT